MVRQQQKVSKHVLMNPDKRGKTTIGKYVKKSKSANLEELGAQIHKAVNATAGSAKLA